MDEKSMIDDLVKMLDAGITEGLEYVNVETGANTQTTKNVQKMGCTDCSRTPLACSVPTLHQGLDDYQ